MSILKPRLRRTNSAWELSGIRHPSLWQRLTPPQMLAGSFLLLIALGTLGFKVLPGLYTGPSLSWLDALFTATSAVCVTGLIVVDTATYFTPAGQAYLLLLIQLGGLGMMAFASLIILALGRRLSLRQEALAGESRVGVPAIDPRRLTLDVVRFTFVIEAIGALVLYLLWAPRLGWVGALWPAVFHSVSAFCNAGFSIFSDSLVGFQQAPLSLGVIMALIIAGGLGFLTMEEGVQRLQAIRTGQRFRISMQTSLILLTTSVLILAGWILFAVLEWNVTLRDLPVADKLVNALFKSVTSRTAGFNSVDYAKASDSANFLTILLMTIGGSPGSTAGGIKTTTFALLGLLAWSRLRGYETTNFLGRSVREETTDRAVGLFVIAFGLITAGLFLLTAAEHHRVEDGRFLMRMFEVASAFNTVGLSMGLTYELTSVGKWIIIVLMYVGRIGPLTFAAALTIRRSGQIGFRYAYEDVIVG